MNKKTMVIGASTNPSRFSYKAVEMLTEYGIEVIAIGNKTGFVGQIEIVKEKPNVNDVHTVTLYINPKNQKEYYDYLINVVKPHRIIFNPGTENEELVELARNKSIEVLFHCTLIMLRTGAF